jgi:outer membrane receptor for ferrienterochelin and colicin
MINASQRFVPLFATLSVILAAVSCASGGTSGAAPATDRAPTVSPSGNAAPARSTASVLIADDLQRVEAQNLADAIQRLRPEWLRRNQTRGASSAGGMRTASEALVIWVDNNRAGGTEILAQMQVSNVRSVRYFTPSEAQSRFGNGNTGGAIQVVTMSASKP